MGTLSAGFRKWSLRGRHLLGRLLVVGRHRFLVDGLDIEAPPDLVSIALRRQIRAGTYEADELRAVADHLDPKLPVLEFGGGIGLVACAINRQLTRPQDHIVVEMNPKLLPVLHENGARNGALYEVRNAALWYDGEARVDTRESYCGSAVQSQDGVMVPKTTIRDILTEKGWSAVNLVLDVEGAEHRMAVTEWPTIAHTVNVLVVEVHSFNGMAEAAQRTQAILASAGFVRHEVYGMTHVFTRQTVRPPTANRGNANTISTDLH